jgi:hypothetical protein
MKPGVLIVIRPFNFDDSQPPHPSIVSPAKHEPRMLYAAARAFLLPLSHESTASLRTAYPLAVSPWRPGRDGSRLDRSSGRCGRTPALCLLPTARFLVAAPRQDHPEELAHLLLEVLQLIYPRQSRGLTSMELSHRCQFFLLLRMSRPFSCSPTGEGSRWVPYAVKRHLMGYARVRRGGLGMFTSACQRRVPAPLERGEKEAREESYLSVRLRGQQKPPLPRWSMRDNQTG